VSSFGVAATQLFFRELKRQKFESASMPLIFFVQNTFDRSYFPGCHTRTNTLRAVGFSYAKREGNHCGQPFVPLS